MGDLPWCWEVVAHLRGEGRKNRGAGLDTIGDSDRSRERWRTDNNGAANAALFREEPVGPLRHTLVFVCAEGESPQSLFRGGLRNVGRLRGDRPAVRSVRPDDARSGSLQRPLEINPHGTGRRSTSVCRDGWIGADDANPLGLVRPGVAWLEAADRTNHGTGEQGRDKAVESCAGRANGSNR